MSYPFGSGAPSQNPPAGQPQQPFGASFYPGQNAPHAYPPQHVGGYPPHQGGGGPGYPPQPHVGAPSHPGYPTHYQGFPPNTGYPPGQPTHSGYPPQIGGFAANATGYPPQSIGVPGYPPAAHGGGAYPVHSATATYPSPYPPPAASGYPAMPIAGYPNNTQYPPPVDGGFSTNPHRPPTQPMAGMAGCFREMSHHVSQIQNENSSFKLSPTVKPAVPFHSADDAKALRKAMKGFGTDEDTLIQVLCHRSNAQIQQIKLDFKTSFGKDLVEDIKSETSGRFEQALLAILTPRVEYYVQELQRAIAGVGTDEDALVEILCSLNNYEIQLIKSEYHRLYYQSLEAQLESETSGHFRRLLISLCSANRDESGHVDPERARQDAVELRDAGVNMVGTDESVFNGIICQRNYAQLRLICDEYERLTGRTLVKTIDSEFSGDIKDGLKSVVRCVSNRAEFFAKCLYKSMAGLGTNDSQLIRVLVTRCEIDLADIKVAFQQKYGKTLRSFIQGDTSGHYKHALYHLIGETASTP